MKKRILLSYLLSIALLSAIIWIVGVEKLADIPGKIAKLGIEWFLLIAFLYCCAFVFRALRWKYLLEPIVDVKKRHALYIIFVSFFANNLLPARLGEIVRAYLLSKKYNVGKVKSFSTVVVDRVVDGITLIVLFALLVAFSGAVPQALQYGMLLPLAVFALLLFVFLKPKYFNSFAKPLLKRIPFVYKRLEPMIEDLVSGGSAFSHGLKSNLFIWGSSFAIWLIETAVFFLVANRLGIELTPVKALVLLVVVAMASMIPSAPAYAGTFEAAFIAVFLAFGLQQSDAFAFALTMHAIEFVVIMVAGIVSARLLGLSFRKLLKMKEAEEEKLEKKG
jgi:uncharacterized protein (TIRG00374 family)